MQKDKKNKDNKILAILIITLILIDQIIKICIIGFDIQIGNPQGWGIMLEQSERVEGNVTYILLSIIIIMLLIRYINTNNTFIKLDSKIVLSFSIAGAASNMIDRIWKGYVLNYIHIPNFIQINLAYIYIIITWVGMAVILTKYTMWQIKERKSKNENRRQKFK